MNIEEKSLPHTGFIHQIYQLNPNKYAYIFERYNLGIPPDFNEPIPAFAGQSFNNLPAPPKVGFADFFKDWIFLVGKTIHLYNIILCAGNIN